MCQRDVPIRTSHPLFVFPPLSSAPCRPLLCPPTTRRVPASAGLPVPTAGAACPAFANTSRAIAYCTVYLLDYVLLCTLTPTLLHYYPALARPAPRPLPNHPLSLPSPRCSRLTPTPRLPYALRSLQADPGERGARFPAGADRGPRHRITRGPSSCTCGGAPRVWVSVPGLPAGGALPAGVHPRPLRPGGGAPVHRQAPGRTPRGHAPQCDRARCGARLRLSGAGAEVSGAESWFEGGSGSEDVSGREGASGSDNSSGSEQFQWEGGREWECMNAGGSEGVGIGVAAVVGPAASAAQGVRGEHREQCGRCKH